MIRALSVPIILVWLALTAVTNTVVPQLEAVGRQNSVSLSPHDAPALIAMKRLGSDFQQFNSD
ncbi:MAG: MMPL family transporter, partial [Mycolicibacterium sp.]|nr:MMPL family transporter [Mycolicibacterium sp.]